MGIAAGARGLILGGKRAELLEANRFAFGKDGFQFFDYGIQIVNAFVVAYLKTGCQTTGEIYFIHDALLVFFFDDDRQREVTMVVKPR